MKLNLDERFYYRGKTKNGKRWVTGYYFRNDGKSFILQPNILKPYNPIIDEIDPDTLCFSLVYYDSHWNRIYDKDIVEFTNNDGKTERYLLQWHDEGQEFQAIPLVEGDDIHDHDYYFTNFTRNIPWSEFIVMLQNVYGTFKKIEVIGNVIDNYNLIPALYVMRK